MFEYEYRVVCAPRRALKLRGLKRKDDAFAETFAKILNEEGRLGWSYVRTDVVTQRVGRWPLRRREEKRELLIFRREKGALTAATARNATTASVQDEVARVQARRVTRPDLVNFVRSGGRRVRVDEPAQPAVAAE